jgi:hypothetical protein
MRVADRGSSQARAERAPGGGFGEALRRARDGDGAALRGARPAGRRPEPRPRPGRAEPSSVERGGAAPPAPSPDVRRSPEAQATPELATLARALPVAVAAAVAREGAPLALSFGRSLDVELRAGTGGIELVLRPEHRLERAADAELPRLVAALRIRGVAVARAEVRPRGGARRAR